MADFLTLPPAAGGDTEAVGRAPVIDGPALRISSMSGSASTAPVRAIEASRRLSADTPFAAETLNTLYLSRPLGVHLQTVGQSAHGGVLARRDAQPCAARMIDGCRYRGKNESFEPFKWRIAIRS